MAPALRAHIATVYSENPDNYREDLATLDALRTELSFIDRQDAVIPRLLALNAHLDQVALKFPVDEHHVRICFTWSNVGNPIVSLSSSFGLWFERAAVLWNLGALFGKLACHSDLDSVDGIKRACSMFQNAAGCFERIKLLVDTSSLASPDYAMPLLEMLVSTMLAQAQEMFYEKAVMDKLKDLTLAKLSSGAEQLYSKAHASAKETGLFHSDWVVSLDAKAHFFKSITETRRAAVAKAEGQYGEEVARLQVAAAEAKSAFGLRNLNAKLMAKMKAFSGEVDALLASAKRDNDVIYIALVPSKENLAPVSAAIMVKASLQPEAWLKSPIPTLFAGLMPLSLHKAASEYSNLADTLVRDRTAQLQDASDLAQATLQSLNLPASLEAAEAALKPGAPNVPPTTSRRAAEVRDEGGVRGLDDSWATLVREREKVFAALDDSLRVLEAEEAEDEDMRRQFSTRWTRPRSKDLTGHLRDTERSYRDKMGAAKKSDDLIRGKIDANYAGIFSLSLSSEEIAASLPVAAPGKEHIGTMNKLKATLGELAAVRSEMPQLINKLKEIRKNDDTAPLLAAAMRDKKDADGDAMFKAESKKYDAVTKEMDDWVKRQSEIMDRVSDLNTSFASWKVGNESAEKREKALQNLDKAYKAYKEVTANLKEGLKFYTDFQVVVNRFNQSCRDFATTRTIDKKEFLAQVQQSSLAGRPPPPWNGQISFNPNPPATAPPSFYYPRQ
ncbi:BRO1-like domain-containing protein [Zopfochytrium polystomum]|nr:BRO1-like domain-containing protein [Zopfochytrium polystomum]